MTDLTSRVGEEETAVRDRPHEWIPQWNPTATDIRERRGLFLYIEEAVSQRWNAYGTPGLDSTAADFLRPAEEASRWLTPEILLPGQDPPVQADHWLPRLCLALLMDTLKCLGTRGRTQREAWEWIRSDAEDGFSFTAVCAVLQLNARVVRRQVTQRFAPDRARAGNASRLPQHKVGAQRGRHARP